MEPKPTTEFTLTIYRTQGDPIRFKITRDVDELRNVGSAIEDGMSANYLGVELGGKLTIVPTHQITSIDIEPAPHTLIAHVIRDATAVGGA